MERREFLKAASLTAAGAMLPANHSWSEASERVATRKPNIIFIVSDQHRAGLTARSGYPLDTSPTLDKLAKHGVGFDRAYCTTPLCVPSRTSMLTGRWPEATRVRMNLDAQDAFFSKDLYQVAKEQGYRTGLAGKNHTYLREGALDFWRGYGHWEGWKPTNAPREYYEYDKWMGELEADAALTPTPFPVEVSYPYRIVSDAIDFIDKSGAQPFILQVGFPEPHDPSRCRNHIGTCIHRSLFRVVAPVRKRSNIWVTAHNGSMAFPMIPIQVKSIGGAINRTIWECFAFLMTS